MSSTTVATAAALIEESISAAMRATTALENANLPAWHVEEAISSLMRAVGHVEVYSAAAYLAMH